MFLYIPAILKLAVDKFPHTDKGIRYTSYPLVPCGDSLPSVEKSPINQRISPFWK